jgi:hypothetical protein
VLLGRAEDLLHLPAAEESRRIGSAAALPHDGDRQGAGGVGELGQFVERPLSVFAGLKAHEHGALALAGARDHDAFAARGIVRQPRQRRQLEMREILEPVRALDHRPGRAIVGPSRAMTEDPEIGGRTALGPGGHHGVQSEPRQRLPIAFVGPAVGRGMRLHVAESAGAAGTVLSIVQHRLPSAADDDVGNHAVSIEQDADLARQRLRQVAHDLDDVGAGDAIVRHTPAAECFEHLPVGGVDAARDAEQDRRDLPSPPLAEGLPDAGQRLVETIVGRRQ